MVGGGPRRIMLRVARLSKRLYHSRRVELCIFEERDRERPGSVAFRRLAAGNEYVSDSRMRLICSQKHNSRQYMVPRKSNSKKREAYLNSIKQHFYIYLFYSFLVAESFFCICAFYLSWLFLVLSVCNRFSFTNYLCWIVSKLNSSYISKAYSLEVEEQQMSCFKKLFQNIERRNKTKNLA